MAFEHRLRAFFCAALIASAAGFALPAHAQSTGVRPEVGKPLQEAQSLIRARKYREALAKVNEADAVANKTPNETLLIQQMRGSAASAAGDSETAVKAYEAVLNSGRVSGREALQMVQAVAVGYYKNRDYAQAAKWTQRYFKEGGTDPAMRTMLLQSYYLSGDCGSVNRLVAVDESRGVSEEELQMLLNCYQRSRDNGGYVATMEKLVVHYPKKEYWTDLLARVQKKPGFSDRLALHVYRLRLATGNLKDANDYMEMAQLALQAGFPAEAKQVVDKGYEVKALGTGKDAERHARLRALVEKSVAASQQERAKDEREALAAAGGDELVKLGMNYVFEGKADKGLPLMEQGIKKGGLKRPEDAKLSLGEAQLIAGHRNRAAQTLRTVSGNDGAADIARLWVLNARA
jgi:outer membrane protein assembly factor BamD (BamD/ComL family)